MTWKPLRVPRASEDPKPVGASLGDVTRRFGLAAPSVLGAIFSDWERLVGPALARHVEPVGLRDGVLLLDVDEPGWVTELQFLHDDLLRRIGEAAGAASVREISVRVRPGSVRRRQERPEA